MPPKRYTFKTKTGRKLTKVNPYWKQIHKLDAVFSVLTRIREASDDGMVKCFTCNYFGLWKFGGIECGHYESRSNMNTRWDPMNNKPQCENCNRVLKGNLKVYRANLVKLYGESRVKALEKRATETRKWTIADMKQLRSEATKLIKQFKEEKGL